MTKLPGLKRLRTGALNGTSSLFSGASRRIELRDANCQITMAVAARFGKPQIRCAPEELQALLHRAALLLAELLVFIQLLQKLRVRWLVLTLLPPA